MGAIKRSEVLASLGDRPWRAQDIAAELGCTVKVATRMMKRHPRHFYMPQRDGASGARRRVLLSAADAVDLLWRVRKGESV